MSEHYITDVPQRKYIIARPAEHPLKVFSYARIRSKAVAKQMAVVYIMKFFSKARLEKRFAPKVTIRRLVDRGVFQVHALFRGVQYRVQHARIVDSAKTAAKWKASIAAGRAPYRKAVRK